MSDSQGKIRLIVNPRSGGGKTERTFPDMRRTIERALGEVSVKMTERGGHGIELAREAVKDGVKLVVSIGGDGTFNEVANGILEADENARPQIAMIGAGTGGDFRKTLGIEHRLDAYLAAITSKKTRRIDIGQLTYTEPGGAKKTRAFVNIVSCGLGGLVDQYVSTTSRAMGGTAAYFGASVKALLRAKLGRLVCKGELAGVHFDREISTYLIAICNGRYFGAGMMVAPMADPSDGVLEVVALGPKTKLGFTLTSSAIYDGKHLAHPDAVHFQCDHLDVDLANEDARDVFLIDLDGEPLRGLPISAELAKGALTLRG